ncbi:MAG: phospholipid scramblase-related protein [Acidimicrobiia bacterium]|nr:phospholipid scramblase-related protein [Acidimicrobiia bacterium]
MNNQPAPNWYPDPSGKHELRYWDGTAWTNRVMNAGTESSDASSDTHVPRGEQTVDKVQRQVVEQAGLGGVAGGTGSLFTEPILVVNQKAKLIEINTEFAVYDQNGNQIGAVRQVGQSGLKKALRMVGDVDQFMTHKFQIVDMAGNVHLTVTRPRKFVKSRLEVGDAAGRPIGQVVQKNVVGKIRFGLEAGGTSVGSINAENWRAWNFSIQDAAGHEVARITKTWEGMAKTMFTTADNYVLQIHQPLQDPLRSLVIASALSVDTALKQDSRGLS